MTTYTSEEIHPLLAQLRTNEFMALYAALQPEFVDGEPTQAFLSSLLVLRRDPRLTAAIEGYRIGTITNSDVASYMSFPSNDDADTGGDPDIIAACDNLRLIALAIGVSENRTPYAINFLKTQATNMGVGNNARWMAQKIMDEWAQYDLDHRFDVPEA